MKVAIIGAGIIGISSAYQVKKTFPNFDVSIVAELFTPDNTSDGAAGLWRPVDIGTTPRHLINKWAKDTLDYANKYLKYDTKAAQIGFSSVHGYVISSKEVLKPPVWKDLILSFHMLNLKDIERFPHYIKSGYGFTTVFIEGLRYIPWLTQTYLNLGGKIIQKKIHNITELYKYYDIIINCSGFGAKELLNDKEVFPIRGQVLRVYAPWVKEFIMSDEADEKGRLAYILVNQDNVVLGGTKDNYNEDRTVKTIEREWILQHTQDLIPSLKHAEIKYDWVGVRPGRSQVRLEKEIIQYESVINKTKDVALIHNYGHGGNGMTVFWGCAIDVIGLVKDFLNEKKYTFSKI